MMLKNSSFSFTPSEQSIRPLSYPSLRNRSEFLKIEAGSACRRKYIKKSEPGGLPKVTRPCSECGKKFSSWKALFGHMRCHPERQWRGINPPCQVSNDCVMNKEDHEVAACLLMLTNGVKEMDCDTSYGVRAEKSDGIKCCTGASQKNVKKGESSEEIVMMGNGNHECNICLRVFSSGQALGGHKRCHWVKWNEEAMNQESTHLFVGKDHPFCFDLNLPASTQDMDI